MHSALEVRHRRAQAFRRAVVASQIIMVSAVLAWSVRVDEPPVIGSNVMQLLFPLLAVVALLDCGFAAILPRFLLSPRRVREIMLQADPSAPLEQAMRHEGDPVHPLRAGFDAAWVLYVIRLALVGSVAVYGVVLSILSRDPRYSVGFATVACAATLSLRFDTAGIEEVYRRMQMEDAWRQVE